MINIVKKEIDKFNPYCLLPDAPADEFDGESRRISEKINNNSTEIEIAKVISEVLTHSFGSSFTIEDCRLTACEIYKSLKR